MSMQRVLKLEAPFDCGMTQYGLGATLRMRWLGRPQGGRGAIIFPSHPHIIDKFHILNNT